MYNMYEIRLLLRSGQPEPVVPGNYMAKFRSYNDAYVKQQTFKCYRMK